MAILVAITTVAFTDVAVSHPSALDTLTVDLLLDESGLVVVDAAANHAGYEHAPSPTERVGIARRVGDALGIDRDDVVQVDERNSTLYHEVGFRVSLHRAFSNALPAGAVRIDTAPLQAIAADFGRLFLDVCGVDKPGITVAVTSSVPESGADRSTVGAPDIDRLECHTWSLGVDDPPATITARATVPGRAEPEVHDRVSLPCGAPLRGGFGSDFVLDGPVTYQGDVLQAHAGGGRGAGVLVADVGFGFRVGTRVEVIVPSSEVGRVTIGAREGPRAARRLVADKCPTDPVATWNVTPLRVWVHEAGCVRLLVKVATAIAIHLPVGAPCKGRTQ